MKFSKSGRIVQVVPVRDHCIVCGAGDTGLEVIRQLHGAGVATLVIDRSPEALRRAEAEFSDLQILEGDATGSEILSRAGVEQARGILLVLPSDRDNLFLTFTARQMQPALRIIARCIDPDRHRTKMFSAGANSVVSPGWIGALRMVSELVRPHATDLLDILMHAHDQEVSFREGRVPLRCEATDKTLGELDFCKRFSVRVVAIRRFHEQGYRYAPPPETRIGGGDRLVFFGELPCLKKMEESMGIRL